MHIIAIIRFICIHIMHSMTMHWILVLGCIGSGSRWWVLWSSCSGWSSRGTHASNTAGYVWVSFFSVWVSCFSIWKLRPSSPTRRPALVVIALHLYTHCPGFEPCLFHNACYMLFWLLNEAIFFLSVTLGRVQRLLQ